jgi:hypothetical protein
MCDPAGRESPSQGGIAGRLARFFRLIDKRRQIRDHPTANTVGYPFKRSTTQACHHDRHNFRLPRATSA